MTFTKDAHLVDAGVGPTTHAFGGSALLRYRFFVWVTPAASWDPDQYCSAHADHRASVVRR